jgi:hypothetical protein
MFLYQNHPAIGDPSLKDKKSLGEKNGRFEKNQGSLIPIQSWVSIDIQLLGIYFDTQLLGIYRISLYLDTQEYGIYQPMYRIIIDTQKTREKAHGIHVNP